MRLLLTILLLIGLIQVNGQTEIDIHQIDLELQNCLDSTENYTTKGMTDCVVRATEKWDIELNINYKQLISLLTTEQKEKLKIAQRKWIDYRDKELEFSNQFFYDMQGTMWITVAAQTKLELTKQRAKELEEYISISTIDK